MSQAKQPSMAKDSLPDSFMLTGGTVIAHDDLRLLSPGYVVVQNGVIREVGEGRLPEGLPSIDLAGRLVSPGMINCHTHIEDAALKELAFGVSPGVNVLFEPDGLRHVRMRALPDAVLTSAMRRSAEQMLASGIVACADYRTGGAKGSVVLRDACNGLPLRCLIFGGHSAFPLQSETDLMANRTGLSAAQIRDVAETVEAADGFGVVWVNDTTDVGLRQIEQVVHGAGKRLSTHSAASRDYRRVSLERTRWSDVQRAVKFLHPDYVVHMTFAHRAEIRQITRAGIPIVMCPRSMASLGRPNPPYSAALDEGAIVGLGTDNVMLSSPDLLAELHYLSRATRSSMSDPGAIDARELLAAVTIDAAKVLDIAVELGSISPGKSASVVIFDTASPNLSWSLNPIASLVDRATSADIEAVIVDGRLVHGSLPVPAG